MRAKRGVLLIGVAVTLALLLGSTLWFFESRHQENLAGSAQAQLAESLAAVVEAASEKHPDGPSSGFVDDDYQGPFEASIRIVFFSDYQCPDCRRVEAEIRALVSERDDISLSAKHFPLCTDCNRHITKSPHPNACWAARAAEAAGILRGNEGFWQMHYWLFDRSGSFTGAELQAGLSEIGARRGVPVHVGRQGSMLCFYLSETEVGCLDDVTKSDRERWTGFFRGMLERGVLLPPSPYEAWFLSTAHDTAAVARLLEAADGALA